MKNLFLLLILSSVITGFTSCRKCTSCTLSQQLDGAPEDKTTVYDQCGNKKEIKEFKESMDSIVTASYIAGSGDTAFVSCVDK